VAYLTLSIDGLLDDAQRAAVDDVVRRQGGSTIWRTSETAGRTYALLELPDEYDEQAIRAASGGTVYERPVIALALFPVLPEALPPLLEALGGPGRPGGVLACRPCAGGVVVEWDPIVTGVELIMGLVGVELARFASGRTAEVLSPLPPSVVAKIAAEGLQAPQIEPKRILELRIDRA
jgi:hypothetical protein